MSPLTGYTVQRTVATSSACGASWTTIGTTPSATGYPDTLGTTLRGTTNYYCYQVAAHDGSWSRRLTRVALARTRPVTAPSAPVMGTVTPGISTLTVAFTVPSSDGDSTILDYAYSLNGGASWTTQATTGSAPNLTMTIGGLTNGTPYSVLVRARNAVGNGAASGARTGTPACGTPGAPTGLKGVFYDRRMHVSWTAPAATGGCAIDRVPGPVLDGQRDVTGADQTTSSTGRNHLLGLAATCPTIAAPGTNYFQVRVRARNSGGQLESLRSGVGPDRGVVLTNELQMRRTSCDRAQSPEQHATASCGHLADDGATSPPVGRTICRRLLRTVARADRWGGGRRRLASGRKDHLRRAERSWDGPWSTSRTALSGAGDGVLVVTGPVVAALWRQLGEDRHPSCQGVR